MIYGKTIVITGVASGIGRATAELALNMGANVIGLDVNQPARDTGYFVKADISTAGGVAAAARQIPSRLDGLCNVAGLSGKAGAAPTLAVNYLGLRALSEALASKIREGGSIVNVASIAGFGWRTNLKAVMPLVLLEGFPDAAMIVADYNIDSKTIYPFTKELLLVWTMRAAHLPLFKVRGIRVNAVSPGPVETPILKQFREVLGDARVDSDIAATGRAGTPEDIAPAILFLCSDAARWINGANIATDGGLEAAVNAQAMGFNA